MSKQYLETHSVSVSGIVHGLAGFLPQGLAQTEIEVSSLAAVIVGLT
jgi:hypothetical protein